MAQVIMQYLPPASLNLSLHASGDVSPDEDFFVVFFNSTNWGTNPRLVITFYTGPAFADLAVFTMLAQTTQSPSSVAGLADLLDNDTEVDVVSGEAISGSGDQDTALTELASKTWVSPVNNEWQFASIPKALFNRIGNGFTWAQVDRVRFVFETGTGSTVYVADPQIVGGGKDNGGAAQTGPDIPTNGGMQGTYKYKVTFLNTVTGNRSNAGPVALVASNVNRGYVALSQIPTSLDPQVDAREIWRTLGNGTRFFKIDTIADNTTLTYDDEVADFGALDATVGVRIMSNEELPIDNDVPLAHFDDFIIDRLTTFWITNQPGLRGRVYFSPIGRIESLKGFISVSGTGDHLHKLVIYNGVRYVFSESKVYRLDGTDPYTSTEISGVPGVQFAQRRTVVATPFGVVYQATDGIRLYDGQTSQLLNFEPMGRVFRGDSVENISSFEGRVATFARGEYLISDNSITLAINLNNLAWRDTGHLLVTGLDYEWDTDDIIAGKSGGTERLEVENVYDDAGSDILIDWESPAANFQDDEIIVVHEAFLDADPKGETLAVFLKHRFGSIGLGSAVSAGRQTHYFSVDQMVLKPSVQLTASVSSEVILYKAELDVDRLEMGIVVEGGTRVTVPGNYREDTVASGSIIFRVPRPLQAFDQTERLFVIARLSIEINTGGNVVTPVITLKNTAVTLATINTATRQTIEIELDRIGPINEFRLEGGFFNVGTPVTVYRVEVHTRELQMGMSDTQSGRRIQQMARASDPETAIVFEVSPALRANDDYIALLVLERVVYDCDTGGNTITPTITTRGGSLTPGGLSTGGRRSFEQRFDRIGTLERITLAGDYIANGIQMYGVEAFMRPLELGISLTTDSGITPGQRRQTVRGRAVDPTSEIAFEVQPIMQQFNQHDGLLWVERIVIEYQTAGSAITVQLDTETNVSIVAGTLNSTSRVTEELTIQRPGPPKLITLLSDFTTDVRIYGIEMYMRSVPLGIQFPDGRRLTHAGRLTNTNTLRFVVDPDRHEVDGTVGVPLFDIAMIDVNSNGNLITPRVVTEVGSIILSDVVTNSRETVTLSAHRIGNVHEIQLASDWTTPIELYGVEIVMRNLDLGVSVIT